MFKRANKITSLLIAAAAVVSLVPATGVSAAELKKIDSEDGIVYDAVAFKDGTAIIDGEVDDNDGAYYLADGKYTELEDVDSGAKYEAYGTKYANVDDGDYFVDLETGTVTDDSVDEDDQDDAASALRKKIKDSDRYSDASATVAPFGDSDVAILTAIPGNKFGETWYATKYKADSTITAYAAGTTFNVYTDAKGNYIDADYNLGKIKVVTTDDSATIENTKDTYDFSDAGTMSAKITTSRVLGQDDSNIYRYADITIDAGTAIGQVSVNNKPFTVNGSGNIVLNVIQKISKAQNSDDIDDAMYAKTVTNYVISDDSADSTGDDATNYQKLADGTKTTNAIEARVIGGKLALFTVEDSATDDNVEVQTATLKSKNGYYYTDLESATTITTEFNSDLDKAAADTDVDGNIYVVDGGYVKVFDGTDDWNKVYKVDGSFDAISAYDADNMVVWSQADEVYSIIGGKTADTTTPEVPEVPVVTAGWAQATNGTWTYTKADGTKATGWLLDGSTWYYLKADGVMATGWLLDGSTWYYLNASGAMAANTTVDGYVLGASGAWVK